MIGSLYSLYAAGMVPPDGAPPSQVEAFMGRLQTQTKSRLYLRAVFGLFSPATISVPGDAGGTDYAFAKAGVQGLRAEFIQIVNDTGGDFARAAQIWTVMHPDLTVYTQSGSSSTTKGAIMPATQSALNWMTANTGFIDKYKSVAAYFIPEQSNNEPYSQGAYRAQLEEGLRVKKTPEDFLTDVYAASAASAYYGMEDQYKSDYAQAQAAGNAGEASSMRQDWLAWSKQFKAAHPAFADQTEGSVANVVKAQGQLRDLAAMVSSGDVPGDARVQAAVAGMVDAYQGYVEFRNSVPGQTNQARADRSAALAQLQDFMTEVVTAVPQVTDLYNGVFRVLNNGLTAQEA
jgi:hypothetical protein